MGRAAFRQVEVRRLIRAAKAEGYLHPVVDTLPDGQLRLLTEPPPRTVASGDEAEDFWARRDAG